MQAIIYVLQIPSLASSETLVALVAVVIMPRGRQGWQQGSPYPPNNFEGRSALFNFFFFLQLNDRAIAS